MKRNISRKLSLNKTTVSALSEKELQMVKGGIGGTVALCFASNADNCTAASCGRGGEGRVVIVCIPV
jgi:hypothetical protein